MPQSSQERTASERRRASRTKGAGLKLGTATGAPSLFLGFDSFFSGNWRGLEVLLKASRHDRQGLKPLPTEQVQKQIWLGLLELAERTMYPSFADCINRKNAAENLAAMATAAASCLEDLASSEPVSDARLNIELAASSKNYWPVLLRLGTKSKADQSRQSTLEGWDKAKSYLLDIHLGENAHADLKRLGDRRANPFKRAAAFIMYRLRSFREHGAWRQVADRGEPTRWARKLLSLGDEMTSANADVWWSVAKVWVDEEWKTNRAAFEPLIRRLDLGNRNYKPSLVKRRVVDDSLKKAFKALAIASDL